MSNVQTSFLCQGGWQVDLLRGAGAEREQHEREILAAGQFLPLPHRCAWARFRQPAESWFFAIRDSDLRCRGGFAAEVNRSRAVPGLLLLRAERFGHHLRPEFRGLAIAALAAVARQSRRILRVQAEVFSPDNAVRRSMAAELEACGFQAAPESRSYRQTIAIDLRSTETELFASLHSTARRHIRAADKNPVAVRPIEDSAWVCRMSALYRETMQRTGGASHERDWRRCIELSRQSPELSRLVGLFRTDAAGPESLLAFAWSCAHGDHAHYDAAASTRHTELKMPLAYPLVWDLLRWAKRQGATWFDFGGITPGSFGDEDRLGGISDFKRYFSKTVVAVGEEWILEPHWVQARLASAVHAGARSVSRMGAVLRRAVAARA